MGLDRDIKFGEFEKYIRTGLKAAFDDDKINMSDELFDRTLKAIRELDGGRGTAVECEPGKAGNSAAPQGRGGDGDVIRLKENGVKGKRARFVRYAAGIAAAAVIVILGVKVIGNGVVSKNDSGGGTNMMPTAALDSGMAGSPDGASQDDSALFKSPMAFGTESAHPAAEAPYDSLQGQEEDGGGAGAENSFASDTTQVLERQGNFSAKIEDEYYLLNDITVTGGRELTLVLYGGTYLDESTYGISKIEVMEEDALLQTILVSEAIEAEWGIADEAGNGEGGAEVTYYTESWAQNGGLTTYDMNFDGAGDIGLMGWVSAGANVPYYYWLWDDDSGSFRYAFCLSNAAVDDENKQLVSDTREGGGEYYTSYYSYDGSGALVLVKQVRIIYNSVTGEKVTETWVLEDGEMVLQDRTAE